VLANFVLVPALGAAPVLTTVASLALMCALPALANWLYYRHVTGIVLRAAALPGDEAARRAYRAAAGGVSWVGPIAVMGLTVLGALLAVSGAGLL